MGEKRRFRNACDAGGSEEAGQGLRGEGGGAGGEKLEKKRKKEAKHKLGSFEGNGKEEAVKTRKRCLSEESNEAQKQHEDAVGGSRASGEAAKTTRAKCLHNRPKSQCWQCEGSSTCEHRRIFRMCEQCNGRGICEHNCIKSGCKQCGWSSTAYFLGVPVPRCSRCSRPPRNLVYGNRVASSALAFSLSSHRHFYLFTV